MIAEKTGAIALFEAVQLLKGAGVADPATDARILLAHALKTERARLTLVVQEPMSSVALAEYETLIAARMARQPVSQIIGLRAFYGRDFRVTPDVLDPRPDTELVIDLALERPFERVLDLGTGTGCILLTLLAETKATGLATDVSTAALDVARGNAEALNLTSRTEFITSDWFADIPPQAFDLIVSNPPYISAQAMQTLAPEVRDWEPHGALTPGGDGLGPYQILTQNAPRYLVPNGRLIVEIGFDQGPQVAQMFEQAGFAQVAVSKDLSNNDRVVSGVWAEN
ncbi:peptide chain release factor N(5)-glutamine methyltransferase [Falsihalocynthiibacter arcticus]|uniref:Release factor glutamine methyltransferase n=1 Tax=Falsihalocynthiibacter arcticus TaxID=1579316 RepID=A0A126V4C8_9RHOB|nr:peptide chain release factor N(5)-glutamine methyltransferase [Falsihalocynthiibacter arcticus]AML53133.1 protein-(glutamine-N5) methyltransferase, release factor-specific [Falsihalocynthiibacter arcticus]